VRVFGRHLGAYTQSGGDLPTQFATESMFCDELSGTSYAITDLGSFPLLDEQFGRVQTDISWSAV
jgi:hypothetical protein